MWLKFPNAWTRLSCALVLASATFIVSDAAMAATLAEQNPDAMMPEQRVAKAREILNQLTEALGGPAYSKFVSANAMAAGHNSGIAAN